MATLTGQTKAIIGEQLRSELGGVDLFTSGGPTNGTGAYDVFANVDQATLDAAFAAHVPDPAFGLPANRVTLHQRASAALASNTAYLALTPPLTVLQLAGQVAALTRQNTALIRLVLNALDSTADT